MPESRRTRFVAAGTAVVLCVSLGVVVVEVATGGSSGPPAQQAGTAAGRPHRAAASSTIGRLVNGRVVSAAAGAARSRQAVAAEAVAAEKKATLPVSRRPKGAVPASAAAGKLKFPVRGKAAKPERATVRQAPAAPVKAGYNAKTSKAVPGQTSANQTVYQNADGTRTAMVYQAPKFYKTSAGTWATINTNLVPAGNGSAGVGGGAAGSVGGAEAPSAVSARPLASASPSPMSSSAPATAPSPSLSPSAPATAPSASPSPSAPSSTPAAAPQGWRVQAAASEESFAPYADAGTLVNLPLGGSASVGFGVQGAAHAAGSASGDTVTYPGALPASDLRYLAGSGLVTEQLMLRSHGAASSYVFPLTLTGGIKAVQKPGGPVEFVNAAGTVVAAVEPGYMTDASIDPHSGDGAYSAGVTYTLVKAAGRTAIKMTLDTAWLDASARVFPVTVDPSVSDVNSNGTTYVESPGSSDYSSDTEIKVGTYNGGTNVAKSFLKFDNISSNLKNDYVLGARLGVFNSWSYSCSPRSVSVYPVTSSWSVSGSKSYPGPSTGKALASKSFATGWVALGNPQSDSPCPNQWEGFNLGTAGNALLNGWTHGTTANNGLALGASSSDSYGWKKFTSDNSSGGDPFLAVTYSTDGASYSLVSKTPVQQVTPTANGMIAIKVTNLGSTTWTPTNGYELSYEVYNAKGQRIPVSPQPFTPMPSTVAPNQSVIVNVKVNELPVGTYAINFDMYKNATSSSPVSFLSEGIQPFAVGLYVPQPPPVVSGVYPPNGYSSPTDTPQLATTAFSTTNTTITYNFTLTCDPLPGTVCPASTVSSGTVYTPYWTVSPALDWDEPYTWTVTATTNGASTTVGPVSITPQVPQPDISSQLGQSGGPAQSGGSSGEPFDPESGNYSTSATDAAVAVPGPALQISRTYNSLNPASIGAFGTGWSSNLDTAVTPDSDGSGSVVVTMPDGSQARFGYKGTGSNGVAQYAPPMGSPDVLTHNANSTWTLGVSGGTLYNFTSAGVLTQITGPTGLTQTFTDNAAGEPVTIKDTSSGRTLSLTWATPAGGLYPHVTSVTTNAPGTGQSGLAWTYSYSDDNLTQVCAATGGCTGYTDGTTSSHYATAVMDSGPRSYYRLGDAAGSTAATDAVDDNLGSTAGTYSNVTLGAAGPLAGTSATAASFTGNSDVSLASNLVSDSTNVTVELWFKDTGDGGVLFSYDAEPITTAASTADNDPHVPALYVGGDGKLYGELWNGSTDPMSSSIAVNDGNWHYAVLSGSATTQSLYLDGNLVGTLAGQISQVGAIYNTVGAGFWAGWPEAISTTSPALTTDPYGHFTGSIGEVAIYPHALGQPAVTTHYHLASLASPELTQVTLPSGRTAAQVSYDTVNDRVTSYTGPSGGTWQVSPSSASGYIASSEGLASVTRYVTVTTPTGYQEVYGYDAVSGGRLTSYTPGNGDAPRTFGYDQGGFLNAMTDADGNLVTFTNDAYGNVLSRTWYEVEPAVVAGPRTQSAAAAASGGCCTTYYTYYENAANLLDPRNGQLTGVADARSASATDTTYLTSYAYNATGELTSSTTPPTSGYSSGRTTSNVYSTSSTPGYGGGTTPAGLLLSQTTPNSAVTSYSYYSDGDLAQQTQPNGARTVYTYDGLGRALTSDTYSDTYPNGLTTTYSYNAVNQPLKVTFPGVVNKVTGVTHTTQDAYTYDADGNLLSQVQSDLTGSDPARTTTYTYNDNGELTSVTGPAGATTGGSAQSQGASSANPAGSTVGYTYDAAGNVATMVDADGNQYDYTYNEYNEQTQVTLTSNSSSSSSSTATCAPGQTPNPDGSCALVLDSYAYDPAGLLAATTDAMGRITNDIYDGNQDLIATQVQPPPATSGSAPPPGRQIAYTYDGAGDLTSQAVSNLPVTTADTSATNWVYNAAGQVSSQTLDPPPSGTSSGSYANRTTSYTYNPDNLVTAQTVSGATGSTTTTYGYNSADDETSQTVQDGSANDTTSWTYDQLGQQTSMVSPDGNASGATPANYTTNYTYDQAGNLNQVTGAPVATATYAAQTPASTRPVTDYGYDSFGDQTQAQDPDGHVTTTAYDGDGRATSVTQPSYTAPGSSSAITAAAKYAYDGNGNLISQTDPAGNTTTYAYDALGDLITQTDPQLTGQSAPGTWTYTYDSDGEPLSSASPTGAQTQATYDYFGDLATSTQDVRSSSGTAYDTTDYTYDYLGDPLTTKTPDGAVTTDTYDHLGELTSTGNDVGDTTSFSYNYLGLPSRTTNPDQSFTTQGYDPAGNLTSAQEYGIPPAPPAVGSPVSTQSYGYDQDGNQTAAKDGNGYTTTFGFNAADEVTSEVQPVSASASDTTKYTYDPAGNQTSMTGGRGNATWTTYNAWNLAESVIEPATAQATTAAQRTWTTAYNADGEPVSVTKPGGITVSYGYDQMGDLTSQSGSGAAASTTAQSFGYDTDGDLTSASAPGGTDQFTYNDAGNLTAASGPSGTASFGYNNDGLMTSRADKAGTTSYTYDAADRPATVADPLTGSTLTYGYNADSLPAAISYAKGGTAGPKQTLGYTGLLQLNSDKLTTASGTTIASESYAYDADGNLSSQATTGYAGSASTSYGYDQADDLTSATTGSTKTSYGYDADGDLTSTGATTYTYNAQDQPTAAANGSNTTGYGYTLSGALASVTPPSGTAQAYTSNAYGQTVTAAGVSYAYDGLGRLATRTSGGSTATLAYSGSDGTVASDGTTSYTYDPSGGPVAEQASGGTAAATLTDVHGDVTAAFSPAAGTSTLAASAAFSPYGGVTASSGSMPALGYQDQYTDPSTGDTDMSARWYAPSTGTFTSSDSTSTGMPDPSPLTPTPYGYVGGDPLTNTDPSGHLCLKLSCLTGNLCSLILACRIWRPTPTASGCEDEICTGKSGAGHQCLEFGKCYTGGGGSGSSSSGGGRGGGGRGGSGGGSGGGCGFYCGVGIGIGVGVAVCSYEPEICASEVEAEPPPPPPPPQDCYAGADPECSPPSPPNWLKDDQYEADKPSETTNPKNISAKDTITGEPQTSEEYLEQHEAEVKNLQQELASENSGADTGNGSGDDSLTRDAGNRAGKPSTPEPSGPETGSPSAGGEGGAGGGGNPPATTPDFPEPPEEPSDITTKVVDRSGYREVVNSSAGPEFIYDNSGAEFETWQQQTLNDIASGNSGSSAASEGDIDLQPKSVMDYNAETGQQVSEPQPYSYTARGDTSQVGPSYSRPDFDPDAPQTPQPLKGLSKAVVITGIGASIFSQLEPLIKFLLYVFHKSPPSP